jgi:hypothetical protein
LTKTILNNSIVAVTRVADHAQAFLTHGALILRQHTHKFAAGKYHTQRGEFLMRKKQLCTWMIAAVFLIGAAGCSSDDKSTGPGTGGGEAPEFGITNVSIPTAMTESSDPMAQMAVGFVGLANSFSGWFGFMTPPVTAAKVVATYGSQDGPWVTTWSDGNLTVTVTVTETSDRYTWEVMANGSADGITYNNFTLIYAEVHKDGSQGSMEVYDPTTDQLVLSWNWSSAPDGTYHFTMTGYDTSALLAASPNSETLQISVTVNPDESGGIEYRLGDGSSFELAFRAEWQSSGAGEWWNYSNGEITETGTW